MEPVITGWAGKRLRTSCTVAACAVLFDASGARANDVSFGGTGADLVPLEQTSVRMALEDIALEYRAGKWLVTATYEFENDGGTETRLQIGFPGGVRADELGAFQ